MNQNFFWQKTNWLTGLVGLVGFAFLLFTGCGKNVNPDVPELPLLEISVPDVTLPDLSGGSTTASFTSSEPWALELTETKAAPGWFDVNPKSGGAGAATITISIVKANDQYDDRSAYIKIKAGSVTKIITVTQKKKNALLLTKDRYEIAPEGGTFEVEVKSNVNYQVTVDQGCLDWILKGAKSKALTTSGEVFTVLKGSMEGNREGMIIFNSGELRDTVRVYQARWDGLILTRRTQHIDAAEQSFPVELTSNVEYDVIIGESWLHRAETKASRVDRILFVAEEHTGYDNRTAQVIFKDKNAARSDTLTVTQAAKSALILSQKKYTAKQSGERIEVELKANITYEVMIPKGVDWVKEMTTKGLNTYNHTLDVAPNPGSASRQVKIAFKDTKSELSDTLQITQNGVVVANPYIRIIYPNPELDGILIPKEGGIARFQVESNVDYALSMSRKDSAWIHQKSVVGGIYEFNVSRNLTQEMVMGKIQVANSQYQLKETVLIGVLPNVTYYLNVPKTLYELPWRGEMQSDNPFENGACLFDINFSTNDEMYDWWFEGMTDQEQWCYLNSDENGDQKVLHVTASQNNTPVAREVKLKLATIDRSIGKTVTIRQEAAPAGYPEQWRVTVLADELPTLIREQEVKLVKELVVRGSLSENDVKYINRMESLEKLDLFDTDVLQMEMWGWMLPQLNEVRLPAGLQVLGMNTFAQCVNLRGIELPATLREIRQGAFRESGLIAITLPGSVEKIASQAFAGCISLASVMLPEESAFTALGDAIFGGCISLSSVYGKLNRIGQSMFYGCTALKQVAFSEQMESYVSSAAFEGCSALENISLPAAVDFLSAEAFKGCASLSALYLHHPSRITVGRNDYQAVFQGAGLFRIYIPVSAYDAYEREGWGWLEQVKNRVVKMQ